MASPAETANPLEDLYVHRDRVDTEGSAFVQNFYELQSLIGTIASDNSNAEEVSEEVAAKLPGVQEQAAALDGQPVAGARFAAYYHHGDGQPERTVWNPFSNLPFRGLLRGVEVITPPEKPDDGAQLALVVSRVTDSSDLDIRAYYNHRGTHDGSWMDKGFEDKSHLWLPSGGLQFHVDSIYIQGALRRVQAEQLHEAREQATQRAITE